MRTQLTDDATVIQESWREPERFAVLFDRHAPFIHRYLTRRVGPETADDLLAETFLAAFGKRHRYDPGFPDACPWLYGFATNLIARHKREEARRYVHLETARPAPDLPDITERVLAKVTASSVRARLASELSRLSAADRDVLLLIAWEQLTYEEVARALAIPVGTVRSRLHRARAQLREPLADAYKELTTDE